MTIDPDPKQTDGTSPMAQHFEPVRYPLTFDGEVIGYAYAGKDGHIHGVITVTEVAAHLNRINTTTTISIREPIK